MRPLVGSVGAAQAAFVQGTNRADLLFGLDDDTQANAQIQPTGAVNQSLDKTDILEGGNGDDVPIGLGGSDVLLGGNGDDILIGGTPTCKGQIPNKNVTTERSGTPGRCARTTARRRR